MTRADRTRTLRMLSDVELLTELQLHFKRALWTMKELDALLAVQGATWGKVGVVAREVIGHLGRVVAICREGAASAHPHFYVS